MTKRLAIIPARGGSKRIPKKNIRKFCGKPIISYILDTAKKSGLFAKIHVSTDSDEIYNYLSEIEFKPDFKRPKNLSGDHTKIIEVMKFVFKEYIKKEE